MWLFGTKNTAVNRGDKVWMRDIHKYAGLLKDIRTLMKENKLILVVYYFRQTGIMLNKYFEDNSLEYTTIHTAGAINMNSINCVESASLNSEVFIANLQKPERDIIIFFTEHYPLFETENTILKSIGILGKKCSYCFYMSLEDPLMTLFGGDRITDVITKMGMKEDEMISHTMISSAIENVQKKIESKVYTELKSDSIQEWVERNLRYVLL